MAKLTDKTTATAVTQNSLIHIVNTNDVTQDPAGSSYKADLGQVAEAIGGYQYYTAVTISSSDILSSNSVPLEILPNPGVANYYDAKFIMEFNYRTTTYVSGFLSVISDGISSVYNLGDLSNFTANTVNILQSIETSQTAKMQPNNPLYFFTESADPTVGDGDIILKIWYTIRTFG